MTALTTRTSRRAFELRISDDELRMFQELTYAEAGIRLPDSKRNLIQGRLSRRIAELGYSRFDQYYQVISDPNNATERMVCIEALTTNETFFFRHKQHWDFIGETIVSEVRQRHPGRPFRAWCAACSTGEEPYSLAILLDNLTQTNGALPFRIFASDINSRVVKQAQQAVYDEYALQKVTNLCRSRYFVSHYSETFEVTPDIRKQVNFSLHNLTKPAPHKDLDLVMLRNVLIYFDAQSKQAVINHMASAIRPGGYLILGGAESMAADLQWFTYVAPAIYRRNNNG